MIHEINYVNPESGAHTQGEERQWTIVRAWWQIWRGNTRLLQSHLDEVAQRALHGHKKSTTSLFHQFQDDSERVRTISEQQLLFLVNAAFS